MSYEWGFHRATGRVVDIYRPKGRRFATSELAKPEDIEGEVVSLPLARAQFRSIERQYYGIKTRVAAT